MIVDGRMLGFGEEKEHELCIVGSGIARMLLVMELAHIYKDIFASLKAVLGRLTMTRSRSTH